MNLKKRIIDKSKRYIKAKKLSHRKTMMVLFFGLTIGNILGFFERIIQTVCNRKKELITAISVLVVLVISVTYFFYVQNNYNGIEKQIYYSEEKPSVQIMKETRNFSPSQVDKFVYIEDASRYMIKVNRLMNCVTVYSYDKNGDYTIPIKSMACSTGKSGHETPLGKFKLSDKSTWCLLVGDVWGQYAYRINGDIMFHSVPYFKKTKDSLEAEEYNKLGDPASLGCVRLAAVDAKWIYDNCGQGTLVEIYEDENPGPLGKPESLEIEPGTKWDPTDPDQDNPFN